MNVRPLRGRNIFPDRSGGGALTRLPPAIMFIPYGDGSGYLPFGTLTVAVFTVVLPAASVQVMVMV